LPSGENANFFHDRAFAALLSSRPKQAPVVGSSTSICDGLGTTMQLPFGAISALPA
jgi:hypothetical protein